MNKSQVRKFLNKQFSLTSHRTLHFSLPQWQEISELVKNKLNKEYWTSWNFMIIESSILMSSIFTYIKDSCRISKSFIAKAYFGFTNSIQYYQQKNLLTKKYFSINEWVEFFQKLLDNGHTWLYQTLINHLNNTLFLEYQYNWWFNTLNEEINAVFERYRKEK